MVASIGPARLANSLGTICSLCSIAEASGLRDQSMTTTYDITFYGRLIADGVRTNAYAQALRQTVWPGSTVLDIGTGTGIWALLACRYGARKVYALDTTDAIEVGRLLAVANGYADRIEFIQQLSTRVSLPERVDIVVADLHGVLPLFEQNLHSLIDARQRLLAPGGTMIPLRETLWAAVAEAPELYRRYMQPWEDRSYGIDLRPCLRFAANSWGKALVKPHHVLVPPACWATLDYTNLQTPHVTGEVAWTVESPGTGHGLLVWFDTVLADRVHFSNAPTAPEVIYGRAYFPWPDPVPLATGDLVSVALRANLVYDDYVCTWKTRVVAQGGTGPVKACFDQSDFYGTPMSPTSLHKKAATYVPERTEEGELDLLILSLMNGSATLGDIASRVSARFPERFLRRQDALAKVAAMATMYS
jgi:protein arginine N-methyltransferase 1